MSAHLELLNGLHDVFATIPPNAQAEMLAVLRAVASGIALNEALQELTGSPVSPAHWRAHESADHLNH